MTTHHPTTRAAWRAWLAANYDRETEIWLVYNKRHTGGPRVEYDDAVEEALCFGWIDSIVRTIDADRYAQKFTPRRAKSKWSELNKRRFAKMVAEGKMTAAGLARSPPEDAGGVEVKPLEDDPFRVTSRRRYGPTGRHGRISRISLLRIAGCMSVGSRMPSGRRRGGSGSRRRSDYWRRTRGWG